MKLFTKSSFRKHYCLFLYGISVAIIVVFSVISLSSNSQNIHFESDTPDLFKSPKISADWEFVNLEIDGDATGIDAKNWTWATSQDWCSGSGTQADPYVIENITLVDSEINDNRGLYIHDSSSHFIIQNCEINGYELTYYYRDGGIFFSNVSNGRITNCNLNNNYYAINFYDQCENMTVSNNNITGKSTSNYYGVYSTSNIRNITAFGNLFKHVYDGFHLSNCDNSNITQNTIDTPKKDGIYLSSCEDNFIVDNSINNAAQHGILLASSCVENNITFNTISASQYSGIYIMSNSNYNNVSFNLISESIYFGIRLYNSRFLSINNNTMTGSGLGIFGYKGSSFNIEYYTHGIENNTVDDKKIYYFQNLANLNENNYTDAYQIYLINCNDSTISNQIFSTTDYGVVSIQCDNISIINNFITESFFDGIYAYKTYNSNISRNNIEDIQGYGSSQGSPGYGIYLDNYCENITVQFNNLTRCNTNGLHIDRYCLNTSVIGNNISYNSNFGVSVTNYCQNLTIFDNNIRFNGDDGIYLTYVDHCEISSNLITNNYRGIRGTAASYNLAEFLTIVGNNISDNTYHGVEISYTHNVSIHANVICQNGGINYNGIQFNTGCLSVNISYNKILDNGKYGLYLSYCEFFTIENNNFTKTGFGILGTLTNKNQYTHYFNLNNTIDGKYIYYYVDENGLLPEDFSEGGQIYLINTNNSIIENLDIINRQYGIFLYKSNEVEMTNCNLTGAILNGIYMYYSNYNNFTSCIISNSQNHRVQLNQYCSFNIFKENNITNVQFTYNDGIYLNNYCNNNTIENNFISQNNMYQTQGISLINNCNGNNIRENFITDNNWDGIYFQDYCNLNYIVNNSILRNNRYGIYFLDECQNNNIFYNNISGNYGMYYDDESSFNRILYNNVSNTQYHGIYVETRSVNNTIYYNSISHNGLNGGSTYGYGIYINEESDSNFIKWNNISYNNLHGIWLDDDSDYCQILYNNISYNNQHGIYLYDLCDSNEIYNNSISYNSEYGIKVENNCDSNEIVNCSIVNNTVYGIYIITDCQDSFIVSNNIWNTTGIGIGLYANAISSEIYFNNFSSNGLHAVDEGFLNLWDNGTMGNYWDDFTGNDWDDDFIGNMSYYISPNGEDHFPIWWDGFDLQPKPNISSTGDTSYFFGHTGYTISWNANTTYPNYYNITRNGSIIATGLWENNIPIIINVDSLQVGIYQYVCFVNSTRGDFSSDSVLVTVIRTYPIITATEDVEFNVTENVDPIIWSVNTPLEDTALIYRNGVLLESNTTWISDEPFVIDINGLDPGIFTFEIYVNSTSNEIAYNSITISVLEPLPTITHPKDLSYIVLSSNNNITWVGTSLIPDYINVFRDNILIFENPWNSGDEILIPIDGLMPGMYLYECYLNSTTGLEVYDAVIVNVVEPRIIINHPSDIYYIINDVGYNISWSGESLIPDKVLILRDGVQILMQNWTNLQSITINVDDLPSGSYLYECYLNSTSGSIVYDSVIVIVEEPIPSISQPQDVEYEVNQTNSSITWFGVSPNPDYVTITRNGETVFEGVWESGAPITIDVGNLTAGTYLFECILMTASGNNIRDSVLVIVEDSNDDGGSDGAIVPRNGPLWWIIGILCVFLAGSISAIIFLVWRQRNYGQFDIMTRGDIQRNETGENKVILMTDSDRQILDKVANSQKTPSDSSKRVKFAKKKVRSAKPIPIVAEASNSGGAGSIEDDFESFSSKQHPSPGSKVKDLGMEIDQDRTRIIRPQFASKKVISKPLDTTSEKLSPISEYETDSDALIKEAKDDLKSISELKDNNVEVTEKEMPVSIEDQPSDFDISSNQKTKFSRKTIPKKKTSKSKVSKKSTSAGKKPKKKTSKKINNSPNPKPKKTSKKNAKKKSSVHPNKPHLTKNTNDSKK